MVIFETSYIELSFNEAAGISTVYCECFMNTKRKEGKFELKPQLFIL